MSIKLQDLTSTFTLNTNPLQAGAKLAIAGVGALVAGIGIAAKATMDWAADLDTLGDVADGTGEGLAAMTYIARKSGVGIDAVAKATFNLNKGLLKQNGTLDVVGKKLKDYGISVKDANGSVKDSVQLTDEIAKKYAELGTQQERVNFLTEVYGKAGKDMIDFFDTLAADGGIDKVAQKVKDLGLAIDPARYEQFNRNLEEMKLVGLGLAVGFTEKLMPALEDLTDWAMKKGIPGFIEFKKKLENAFKIGGLGQVLEVLDEEISKGLDGLDWEGWGTKFGELVEGALADGSSQVDVPKSLESLGKGIKDFFTSAIGEENLANWKMLFENFDVFLQFKSQEIGKNLVENTKRWLAEHGATHKRGLDTVTGIWNGWGETTKAKVVQWGREIILVTATALSTMKANIDTKLQAITEKFVSRFGSLPRKASDAFSAGKQVLINTVQGIVDAVNALLKKIITSFRISISWGGTVAGATGTADLGGSSGGGGTVGGGHQGKSALATPVSAVSSPTQSQSGQIELSVRTINALADKLGLVIPTATVKAMNNA